MTGPTRRRVGGSPTLPDEAVSLVWTAWSWKSFRRWLLRSQERSSLAPTFGGHSFNEFDCVARRNERKRPTVCSGANNPQSHKQAKQSAMSFGSESSPGANGFVRRKNMGGQTICLPHVRQARIEANGIVYHLNIRRGEGGWYCQPSRALCSWPRPLNKSQPSLLLVTGVCLARVETATTSHDHNRVARPMRVARPTRVACSCGGSCRGRRVVEVTHLFASMASPASAT